MNKNIIVIGFMLLMGNTISYGMQKNFGYDKRSCAICQYLADMLDRDKVDYNKITSEFYADAQSYRLVDNSMILAHLKHGDNKLNNAEFKNRVIRILTFVPFVARRVMGGYDSPESMQRRQEVVEKWVEDARKRNLFGVSRDSFGKLYNEKLSLLKNEKHSLIKKRLNLLKNKKK